MVRIGVSALIVGLILLLPAGGRAVAHPHVWIDMRTAALLDDRERVAALRIEWLFDRFYSAFAQEDVDTDGNGVITDAEADRWARTALENIAKVGYFAEILVDGQSRPPVKAGQAIGRWRDGQLHMSFVVHLDQPADPRKQVFGYMAYDPDFYIDIRHPDGAGAAMVEGPGSGTCTAKVGRSEPSPETVASAAALGPDETAPSGLGRLFADYVKVTCQ